jgi:hypothetical protein
MFMFLPPITVPTLTVAAIYCLWLRAYMYERQQRQQKLRERVAYMLWTAAMEND